MDIVVHEFYDTPKTYYQGYEAFCYQNCLRLILEGNKVTYASLYINSALSLIIDIEPKRFEYDFKNHKNSRSFLGEYANKVTRHFHDLDDDPNEIFIDNINKIRRNSVPIIVGVDVFHLHYTPYYQKSHANHTLVLCGYSEYEDLVYIIDWYEPWFFKGTMTKQEFLLARNSKNPDDGTIYSGCPISNNWAEVDGNGWNKTPQELLTKTLDITLKQYFEPCKSELIGVYAIKALKDSIIQLNEAQCDSKLHIFKELHKYLYMYMKRHKFFKQYLEIAYDYVKTEDIKCIISNLSYIIEKWDTIIMLVLKASMVDSVNTQKKLIDHLDVVIEREAMLGYEISRLYQILNSEVNY